MLRPPSIIRYEQLYLVSFTLGLVASAMSWEQRKALLAANPMLIGMDWILPATFVVGIVIALTLWYFTARRASVVAKWAVVVLAGFSAIGILLNLMALIGGNAPAPVATALSLIVSGLYIAAAVMLFRPDARAWFGEDLSNGDDAA